MVTIPIVYGQRAYPQTLGESNVTIAGFGCAITSLCMFLEYLGIRVTPPELNDWLIKNKGYAAPAWNPAQKNLVIWDAINRFSNKKLVFKEISKTPSVIPCVAEVDLVPNNSQHDQHFVLYLGDGMCADPWTKRIRPISDFGGAISYRIYEFKVSPVSPTTGGSMASDAEFKQLQKDFDSLREKENRHWDVLKNKTVDPLAVKFGVNQVDGEDIAVYANRVLSEVVRDYDNAVEYGNDLQGDLDAANLEITRLTNELNNPANKPGIKTSEFWNTNVFAIVATVSPIMLTYVLDNLTIAPNYMWILGLAVIILQAAGLGTAANAIKSYQEKRTQLKLQSK